MNDELHIKSLHDIIFNNYDKIPSNNDISKKVILCILSSFFKTGCSEQNIWFFNSLSNLHIHTFFKQDNIIELRNMIHHHKLTQDAIMDLLFTFSIELSLTGFNIEDIIQHYSTPMGYVINDKSNVVDLKLLLNLNDSKMLDSYVKGRKDNIPYILLLLFIIRVEITNILLVISKYHR